MELLSVGAAVVGMGGDGCCPGGRRAGTGGGGARDGVSSGEGGGREGADVWGTVAGEAVASADGGGRKLTGEKAALFSYVGWEC